MLPRMSITAIVKNDTIKLPIHVPDGTSVEILLPDERLESPEAKPAPTAKPPAFAWMKKYAGCITTLPPDAAERHTELAHGRKRHP